MQVLRLKKKTSSRIEVAHLILTTYCTFSNIKIGKTELEVLSYFAVYGTKKSTKNMIIKSGILTLNSLENTMTRLRKLGLLRKGEYGEFLMKEDLQFTVDGKMGLIIKIENS